MDNAKELRELKQMKGKIESEKDYINSDIHILKLDQISIDDKINELTEKKKEINKELQEYDKEIKRLEKIVAANKPIKGQLDVFGGEVGGVERKVICI